MSDTCAECMITVVTPAAVASSAAISFVDIPPVPRELPSVEVDTDRASGENEGGCGTLLSCLLDISDESDGLGVRIMSGIVSVPSQDHRCQPLAAKDNELDVQTADIGQEEEIVRMYYRR